MDERTKAIFSISNNPDLGRIFERFAKRNIQNETDGEKQKILSHAREQMAVIKNIIDDTKKIAEQKEKIRNRKNIINKPFDSCNFSGDETH